MTASRRLEAGEEVTVETDPHIIGEVGDDCPFLVTFDGGARECRQGGRAAGAGAILWGPASADGQRTPLRTATVALPGVPHAQEAEAAGCGAGLGMLGGMATDGFPLRAMVAGDNLGVVRYGAGTARLRRPEMAARIDEQLGRLLAAGWRISWRAVRRRLNRAADRLATAGFHWAEELRTAGGGEDRVRYQDAPAYGDETD